MGVHVPKAGDQELAEPVDRPGVCRRSTASGDGRDRPTVEHYGAVRDDLSVNDINDADAGDR
jgi:hypothetical protein